MFRLADDWVWDSWVADDGELFHLFFLMAPRSLEDPERRHLAARIGHATSSDLVDWTYRGVALEPAASGWDDVALWTGSVLRGPDGRWRMFYTALSSSGLAGHDQRIGVAVSDDLFAWHRVGDRPIVEVDPRWYRTYEVKRADGGIASETWRDPFVFADPSGDGWHMVFAARSADGVEGDDGVLGHARSSDLCEWTVLPPLSTPGAGFSQLEVPHVHVVDGRPVLTFTCAPPEQATGHRERWGEYSTWSVVGTSLTGPWDVAAAQPFRADPALFAAPLVQRRTGDWVLLGFRHLESAGVQELSIGDPIPVEIVDGGLQAR